MNYPIPALAIIAPILFFALLAMNILVGVFGGWKKAVYWGGGNFVFYCIGLIVWLFVGDSIANLFQNLFNQLFQGKQIDFSKIILPIAAMIFFIGVLIVGNLLLMICWFAFAKRLLKINEDKAKWKEEGQLKKAGKLSKEKIAVRTRTGIINKVVGGVGLPLLMFPSLLVGTSLVSYATTSVNTRTGFNDKFHSFLVKTNNALGGFSYANGAGEKFDALFSGLNLMNTKIDNDNGYTDDDGNPITFVDRNGQPFEGELDVMTALEETIGLGINTLAGENVAENFKTKDAFKDSIADTLDNFADNWNIINQAAGNDVSTILSDGDVSELLQDVIGEVVGDSKTTINPSDLSGDGIFAPDGNFEKVVEAYIETGVVDLWEGEEPVPVKTIPQMPVGEESYENLKETIKDFLPLGEGEITEEVASQYDKIIDNFTSLLFKK